MCSLLCCLGISVKKILYYLKVNPEQKWSKFGLVSKIDLIVFLILFMGIFFFFFSFILVVSHHHYTLNSASSSVSRLNLWVGNVVPNGIIIFRYWLAHLIFFSIVLALKHKFYRFSQITRYLIVWMGRHHHFLPTLLMDI